MTWLIWTKLCDYQRPINNHVRTLRVIERPLPLPFRDFFRSSPSLFLSFYLIFSLLSLFLVGAALSGLFEGGSSDITLARLFLERRFWTLFLGEFERGGTLCTWWRGEKFLFVRRVVLFPFFSRPRRLMRTDFTNMGIILLLHLLLSIASIAFYDD